MRGFYRVLCLHVLISVIAPTLGCPMPCKIVSLEEGAEVQVTCDFRRNISHLQTYSVSVIHYRGGKDDPANVLALNRIATEVQNSVAKGYIVDSHNETHVSFTVAVGLHTRNGSYAVKIMSTSGNTTTCVAPSMPTGQQAHVTCNFNRNVSLLNTFTVAVEHYLDEKEKPVPVLLCSKIDMMQCLIAAGYTFDYQVDYSLRLLIPQATDQHTGRYVCDVLSPQIKEPEVPQSCMLELKVLDASSSSTSIPLVIGIAVALLVGAISGFVCGWCVSRRCCPKKMNAKNDEAKEMPESPRSPTAKPLLKGEQIMETKDDFVFPSR